jgi:hypothetical protein
MIDERVVFAFSDRGRSETHVPHHLFKNRGPVGISLNPRFRVRMGIDPRLFAGSVTRIAQRSK